MKTPSYENAKSINHDKVPTNNTIMRAINKLQPQTDEKI